HGGDVGAGLGLAAGVGGEDRRRGEPAEVLRLLGVAAGEDERDGGERVAGEGGADGGAAVVDLFLDEAVVEAGEAEAAVLLGDLEVDEPELPGVLEDLLREL